MAGLQGQLDVNIGDIVRLQSERLDVAGFVAKANGLYVKLAYQDPYSDVDAGNYGFRMNVGKGDRVYKVNRFESCDILERGNVMPIQRKRLDINVGDIICLYGVHAVHENKEEIDVAGYVLDMKVGSVRLSHENPFSECRSTWDAGFRKGWGKGHRWFNVTKFNDYSVLVRRFASQNHR
jgi:hypothetical protein